MKTFKLAIRTFTLISIIIFSGCKQTTTPEIPPAPEKSQDQIDVEAAATKLTLPAEIKADEKGILLPDKVKDCAGVTVTWTSDKPAIIAKDGIVTHADKAESDTVKLIATLKKGNGTATKTFTVTVKNKALSQDEKDVRAVKDSLTIKTIIEASETKIELPVKLDKYTDVTISWTSNNADVITNSGMITHKNDNASDVVILTALIQSGESASDIKKFNVIVKSEKQSEETEKDTAALNTAADEISIISSVNKDVNTIALPSKADKYNITWSSNKPGVINADGIVTHNDQIEQETVTLFATLTLNKATVTKEFTVTVNNELSDAKKEEKARKELQDALKYFGIDNTEINVYDESIELGNKTYGSPQFDVTWTSNNSTIIDCNVTTSEGGNNINAKVTHTVGNADQKVTLTATIEKTITLKSGKSETIKESKDFEVIVKNPAKSLDDKLKEELGKLTIPTEIGEYEASITLPYSLYVDEKYFNIVWETSDNNTIDANKNVHHTKGENKSVTLTAKIKDHESITKSWVVTVKNPATVPTETTEILKLAKANLSLPEPTYSDISYCGNVSLPETFMIADNHVNVSWKKTNENDKYLTLDNTNLKLTKDIESVTSSITATLTYDNQSVTKDFTFTIPAIAKDGNIKINGFVYSYKDLDMAAGIISLKATHEIKNDALVPISEVFKEYETTEKQFTAVENEPTMAKLSEVYSIISQGYVPPEDELYGALIQTGCFENISPSDKDALLVAKNSTPEEKAAAIQKFVAIYKQQSDNQKADLLMKTEFTKYSYTVTEQNMNFTSIYDSTKQWFRQNGKYSNDSGSYLGWTSEQGLIFSFNDKLFKVIVSANGNSFDTYLIMNDMGVASSEKADTWTVTEDRNTHTITIKNGTETAELKIFQGNTL